MLIDSTYRLKFPQLVLWHFRQHYLTVALLLPGTISIISLWMLQARQCLLHRLLPRVPAAITLRRILPIPLQKSRNQLWLHVIEFARRWALRFQGQAVRNVESCAPFQLRNAD